MAFKPQDNEGSVDSANAYGSVAGLRAYWSDRGVDLTAKTDGDLEVAIILATDFLDSRYVWVGVQRRIAQGTQWPRSSLPSLRLRGIPPAVENATYLMAQRALSGKPLMPDPTFDPSGQKVASSTKKVGPIEVSQTFSESSGGNPAASTPAYPEVDLMLRAAGLLAANGGSGSGSLVRA